MSPESFTSHTQSSQIVTPIAAFKTNSASLAVTTAAKEAGGFPTGSPQGPAVNVVEVVLEELVVTLVVVVVWSGVIRNALSLKNPVA